MEDTPSPLQRMLNAAQPELDAFVAVSPSDERHADSLRNRMDDLVLHTNLYDAQAVRVQQDQRLSDTGRAEQLETLRGKLAQDMRETLDDAHHTLDHLTRMTAYTPPKLDQDAHLETLRLQTARMDARLALDAQPADRLPEAMRALVEGTDDPSVQHLLLNTGWGSHYVRARAGDDQAGAWRAQHQQLLERYLPESQRKAFTRQEAWKRHGVKVRHIVNAAAGFALADRGVTE